MPDATGEVGSRTGSPAPVSVVVVGAGKSKRMGSQQNKLFMRVRGKPILAYTLRAFERCDACSEVVVVLRQEDIPLFYEEILAGEPYTKVRPPVPGGPERQDSVFSGLLATDPGARIIAVHDGARPLVDEATILRTLEAATAFGAAIPCVPVKDTIKEIDEKGFVSRTLQRDRLVSVQTPQAFRRDIIFSAYERARIQGIYATDDASLVEMAGYPIKMVIGSYYNIKLTTPEDLAIMEAFLNWTERGYDNARLHSRG